MLRLKKEIAYIAAVLAVVLLTSGLGLNRLQVISLTVFVGIVAGILFYWRFRLAFAMAGISILFTFGVIDIPHFVEFASLDIIVFLMAMMIVIGFLEERRFFEILLDKVMVLARGSATRVVSILMGMAALSAALVDEVTSILFIMATSIRLAAQLNVSIVPLMMMAVFATNIGSSATVVGNPVGVMIALRAGLTFPDFLRWATPIAIVGLLLCMLISTRYFKGYLAEVQNAINDRMVAVKEEEKEKQKIDHVSLMLFIGTFSGLIMHSQIEQALGLSKNTMLIGVAVIAASVALMLERGKARELVEKRVDWWTLSFFMLFFASVGTLKYTGITRVMADAFFKLGGGELLMTWLATGWILGTLSALMDNVLAVAIFIPIISDLGSLGVQTFPLWWVALFGATWLANMTMIGSTANIIAVGIVERQKLAHVTMRDWIVPGVTVSIPTFAVALLLLYIQFPLMPI